MGRRLGRDIPWLIAGVLLLYAYSHLAHPPAIGFYHDDGIYVVTAKALAEGKGYRIISLPNEMPQTKYPILFPAALSVVWRIWPQFPDNASLLRRVPLFWGFVWFFLIAFYFRERTASSKAGVWLAFFTAASQASLFASSTVIAETMFAALTTASLLLLLRVEQETSGNNWRVASLAGIVGAVSFLTRSAGLPLLAGGTLGLLLRRKYQGALLFCVVFGVLVFPWLFWQMTHIHRDAQAFAEYSWASYQSWSLLGGAPPGEKLRALGYNPLQQLLVTPTLLLHGFLSLQWILAVVLAPLLLWGLAREFTDGSRTLAFFVAIYCLMILVWPWVAARLMIPLLPFLLFFAGRGFVFLYSEVAGSALSELPKEVLPGALLTLLLVLNFWLP